MKLYYATTNLAKFNYLKRCLDKSGVEVIQIPLDLPEPRSSDVQEIAKEKVVYAYAQVKKPIVVIDAGFYVFSLRGFPKTYVNFVLETIGVEGVLRLAAGKERNCEFRHCLAYLDEALAEPKYFLGSYRGTLTCQQQGTMQSHLWSELALIFIPKGETKTLAEMDFQEFLNWYQVASENNAPDRQFSEWFRLRIKDSVSVLGTGFFKKSTSRMHL